MTQREPPHDRVAEQAVLGAMLISAVALETCRQALTAADFYTPAHGVIFTQMLALAREGHPVDAIVLNARLAEQGESRLTGGAPYLHTIMAAVPSAAQAPYYARVVREHAVRRRLIEAGTRIVQIAQAAEDDAPAAAQRAIDELEAVRAAGIGDEVSALTWQEFLDAAADEHQWVIEGLLERGDRLILTGGSGLGKSMLIRQLCVCAAAGIHPFTQRSIPPQRVYLLDCENGPHQVRRELRRLTLVAASLQRPVPEQNLWIESRPEGMDLARDKDLSWLLRQVTAVNPTLVAIGPLYKLAPRALNDDTDAAPVLAALNMLRARGAALITEAHHGHEGLHPRGSSALMNWPEMGYGLRASQDPQAQVRRMADMLHWRGDRDERHWPRVLAGGETWPWAIG